MAGGKDKSCKKFAGRIINITMIKNYFKIAWRNLSRNKGYSAINIGGLAVGMAVAMLIGYGYTMNCLLISIIRITTALPK